MHMKKSEWEPCTDLIHAIISDGLYPQIYTRDPRTYAMFYPGMGLKLRVFGFSSCLIKTTTVHQVHMSLHPMRSEGEDKTCKTLHGLRRSWTHLFCVCFVCAVGKKLKTPKLSPMADGAITRGGVEGLCLCMSVSVS